MTTSLRRSFLIAVALALASVTGCAGSSARNNVLGPAMAATWPGVSEDAMLGVSARENPAAAAALGITAVSPGVADSRRERIRQFDAAVNTFTHQP